MDQFLKQQARKLRSNPTEAERLLWQYLRRKQVHDVQFYRQRPIGRFIVDFVATSIRLIVEVDGSQHLSVSGTRNDLRRTDHLRKLGYRVIRFDNRQVLTQTGLVVSSIASEVLRELSAIEK